MEDIKENTKEELVGPQYYADCDENGNIVGFYVNNIHDEIPETAIAISEEEWRVLSSDAGRYKLDGELIREKTREETEDEIASLPPMPPSETELLQDENAMLAVELVETQIRLDQAETEQANLLLELVDKGVI